MPLVLPSKKLKHIILTSQISVFPEFVERSGSGDKNQQVQTGNQDLQVPRGKYRGKSRLDKKNDVSENTIIPHNMH